MFSLAKVQPTGSLILNLLIILNNHLSVKSSCSITIPNSVMEFHAPTKFLSCVWKCCSLPSTAQYPLQKKTWVCLPKIPGFQLRQTRVSRVADLGVFDRQRWGTSAEPPHRSKDNGAKSPKPFVEGNIQVTQVIFGFILQ